MTTYNNDFTTPPFHPVNLGNQSVIPFVETVSLLLRNPSRRKSHECPHRGGGRPVGSQYSGGYSTCPFFCALVGERYSTGTRPPVSIPTTAYFSACVCESTASAQNTATRSSQNPFFCHFNCGGLNVSFTLRQISYFYTTLLYSVTFGHQLLLPFSRTIQYHSYNTGKVGLLWLLLSRFVVVPRGHTRRNGLHRGRSNWRHRLFHDPMHWCLQ